MLTNEIIGAKGSKDSGGGNPPPPRSPEISSTAIMKILIALGEGEFAGDFDGRHIFLNGTPLNDSSGKENFPGVRWEWRSGTQSQDYIQGFPSAQNEIGVSTELRYGTPWVRAIHNTQLSAVRVRLVFPAGLFRQRDDGVKDGWRVEYAIDISVDGGAYVEYGRDAADGIANTGYERDYRINLPAAETGWQIRVRRLTQNISDGRTADTVQIASFTEVIDAKFQYPHTALLYIEFDSKQFEGQTPTVTVLTKGRIVRVPSNYDPINRSYNGVWDGTWKWAWTNNPAWAFFDIVTSQRFGLGDRLSLDQVDKWELYRIARYCDDLVPDGKGGMEPRFLCDICIDSQTDAWTVLMDLASIFRGMISWSNNLLTVNADMPEELDPDYIFTRANVVRGSINRTGSDVTTHYSTGLCTYKDPANNYKEDQTPAFIYEYVKRFSVVPLQMTAVGCNRETEAQRRLLWAIHTNNDGEGYEWKTGIEGRIPRVGKVVGLANNLYMGRDISGRISSVNGRTITVDRDISEVKAGNRLLLNLPTGKSQGRTVESVAGRAITVTVPYSVEPEPESQWAIESDDLAITRIRVKKVTYDNQIFTISGLLYSPTKYDRIDKGAILEDVPTTVRPAGSFSAPQNIQISSSHHVDQGIAISEMEVTWDAVSGAVGYEAQWRQNSGNWINVPRSGNTRFTVSGVYAGLYQVRVRAFSATDLVSLWTQSDDVQLTGKSGKPPSIKNLTASTDVVFSIALNWLFSPGSDDGLKTTLSVATKPDYSDEQFLADVPYPQRSYVLPGALDPGAVMFFRAVFTDKTGNQSDASVWVRGMASNDATAVKGLLIESITETELSKSLLEKINSLPSDVNVKQLADEIASAKNVIDTNRTELQGDVESVRNNIEQLGRASIETSLGLQAESRERGERQAWVIKQQVKLESDQQSLAEEVTQLGANFDRQQASLTRIDKAISDSEKSVAESLEELSSRASENESSIGRLSQAFTDEKSANAQAVERITSDVKGNAADILAESSARTSEDEALGKRITAISTISDKNTATINEKLQALSEVDTAAAKTIEEVKTDTDANASAITELRESVSAADSSRASLVQSLDAISRAGIQEALNQDKSERDRVTSTARIIQSQDVQASEQESQAKKLSSIEAEVDKASAMLIEEELARASGDEALARNIQTLQAKFSENSASVNKELSVLSDADKSQSREIQVFRTEVADSVTSIKKDLSSLSESDAASAKSLRELSSKFNENSSKINQEIETLTKNDESKSKTLTQLLSEVGKNTSALEQQMQTVFDKQGNGKSIYTLKMGVNVDGKFYDAGLAIGVEVINGVVHRQFLVNTSTFAILDNNSGEVTSPFVIQDGRAVFDNGLFGKASIGRLQMADSIESDDYISGRSGIKLDFKNGNIEMNSRKEKGGMTFNGDRIDLYNEDGELTIRIGNLGD
ncbi:TipJ family phage tail tip protein [Pectobacterium brasiliense]|uniref:TipJ family phage tail tip protein n=1 Tax=Pectobacterium brasiliense TaxID=180957 RepID=UPI000B96BA65|nr:DUF1983 domain-containing protein [Pectobacterium carotovorum]OYN52659.1 hypothetical protein B7L51_03905 [Pectobacterium carotovorum]